MFFLFFPIKPSNKNTNLVTNNSNPDYNNTNEKRKKKKTKIKHKHRPRLQQHKWKEKKVKKETDIKNFLHVLQLVLHLIACSSQIKPSIQELKPITRTPKKRKNKLSSLSLSLMNLSSPIHSQQEQLSQSQDPNNMTTQNQDQLSRSQDLYSMTHKTNPSKTQQDPNRMTNLTDLKKGATARSIPVHQNPKSPLQNHPKLPSLSSLPSPTTIHQRRHPW